MSDVRMPPAVDSEVARVAVAGLAPRVAAVVRSIQHPDKPALGRWSVLEVATHLSHAVDFVTAMALGGGGVLSDITTLSDLTEATVGGETERDPGALAARIEESTRRFLSVTAEIAPDETRVWFIPGVDVPVSMLTCHVLNELLMHGRDIAVAEGAPWPMSRSDAGLVVNGFFMPALAAVGRSLVNQAVAGNVRVAYDIRVRGGGRWLLRIDHCDLVVERGAAGPVDCHLSVEPAAFLLVGWARIDQWAAIRRGQLLAWGRRPWLGLKLRSLVNNP